ncbi:MAG: dTDP-4-dehydrorhamnose reductase [Terriglobia bacterium]
MKVLLIGANGQLGSDLAVTLKSHEVIPVTHAALDVTTAERVLSKVQESRPDVILNTSAFHKVDVCESEVLTAFEVNAVGVKNLCLAAQAVGATLVHFSTDYVFEGNLRRPLTEQDETNPVNAYGVSKLAGEKIVRYLWPKSFVIRTCGLYGYAGSSGKGGNFVETMLKKAKNQESIRVVHDQVLTPTSTRELARKVAELIQTEHYGLYHITAQGGCSWYEFAAAIFELAAIQAILSPTTSAEFKSPAKRPAYSVLENAQLHRRGMDDMKSWKDALQEYLLGRSATHNL